MEVRIAWTAAIVAVCCLATELSLVARVAAADDRQELNNCHPPSIVSQAVPKGYFLIDSPINIPCIGRGDGKLTYTWMKNGEPLDLSSEASKKRMTTKPGVGSLVVFKAVPTDEGVYQCSVENSCGTSLSSSTVMLHARMNPFPRVKKPTTIKRVLGSSAILTCNPPLSVPKAKVAWILSDSMEGPLTYEEDDTEGIEINSVPLNNRVTMDYDGNLYITSVRKEDEKNGQAYVCLAQNRLTRSSNKGDDKIIDTRGNEIAEMGVDLMWKSQTENMVLQGKKAKFKCIFSGQPEPEIKWTRVSGGKMDPDRMITNHHELVIKEVQFQDAGEYRCSGRNSLKPEPKTHTFTLSVEAAPQWRIKPRDQDVGVEESASFECDAVGNPTPTVQWFVNGEPYSGDESKRTLDGNTLTFKNLDKEDSQVIQCNASNIYGYIWADVYLYVQALPPEILDKPKRDLIVARDSDVTLTCHVTGKPKPKVVWYKGSQPLIADRFEIQDSGNLLIKKSNMKDKGRYICKAENRFGEVSAAGRLFVRDKTRIIEPPKKAKVDFMKEVQFTCLAVTDDLEMPNLKTRWLKDGVPLKSDNLVEIRAEKVTILEVQSKDSGTYTCVAENGLDNDTATATLEVIAPPDPPYDTKVDECLSKSVTLTWKFDHSMRNFDTMIRFIVEYETEYAPDTWTIATSVDYPRKEATFDLSPFANYKFRVKAVNRMGVSEPSAESPTACKTLMAAPDTNPEDVRSDEQYTNFLVIRWKPMEELQYNAPRFQYVVKTEANGKFMDYNITDPQKDHLRIPVKTIYKPYLIKVWARNQVNFASEEPRAVIGYSGEAAPLVIAKNFELDPDVNVTATMAGFRWDDVDTSVESIRGKFQGYKIRYWIKGQRDTSLHEEIIPSTEGQRGKRDTDADGKVRGRVMNLPSFSEIVADVVVINTNFESEGSNKVNLSTPEGVPGPVEFLEAIYRGSNHIQVFWEQPPQPNGVIMGYQLSYQKISVLDFEERVITNHSIPPDGVRETIHGLEADTQYRIYIRAETKEGLGEDYFIDVKTASEFIKLATPVIQKVFALDNEANVTWTLDLSEKGMPVGQTYYLQYRVQGDKDWIMARDDIQDEMWANLDHLDPGAKYEVRVIATSKNGGHMTPSGIHLFRTSGVGAARASFLTAAWFIGMMIAIAILILILIIVCIVKRNRGDNYPVQEKERLRGNCDDNHDQFNGFGKGSDENGIGASSSFDRDGEKVPLDVDADSMDYGDDDASRFNEDGSFIGLYGTGDKTNEVNASSIV